MNRISTLVWMLVIVVAAFLLYQVKYEVQNLRAQIKEAERQLEAEEESYHVVAAEWAYLNRPERLASLSSKYLSSGSVLVDQIAEVEAIPFPKTMQAAITTDTDNGIRPASVRNTPADTGDAE